VRFPLSARVLRPIDMGIKHLTLMGYECTKYVLSVIGKDPDQFPTAAMSIREVKHAIVKTETRRAYSLWFYVPNIVMMVPASHCYVNHYTAARLRFARRPPPITPVNLRLLQEFVQGLIFREFHTLDCPMNDSEMFWWWWSTTSYGFNRLVDFIKVSDQYRREKQLRSVDPVDFPRVYKDISFLDPIWSLQTQQNFGCLHYKMHIKPEWYPTFKAPRFINAPSDLVKCVLGPSVKRMDEFLFHHQISGYCPFIKHVPVRDRGRFLIDLFGPVNQRKFMISTDHSFFEAHVTVPIARACEYALYRALNGPGDRADFFYNQVSGVRRCASDLLSLKIRGARMSGDMWTSSGNGFTNYCVMMCGLALFGCTDIIAIIEGDDGVFAFNGPGIPDEHFWEEFGMNVRCVVVSDICHAGFCSLYICPTTKHNIVHPGKMIAKIGWSFSRDCLRGDAYRLGLLKAKAFSMYFEAPNNPITSVLAYRLLCLLSSYEVVWRFDDPYKAEMVLEGATWDMIAQPQIIGDDRCFMEECFGISVGLQIELEEYFNSIHELAPLTHPSIASLYSPAEREQYAFNWTTNVRSF